LQDSRIGRSGQRELHVHGLHVLRVVTANAMATTVSIPEQFACERNESRFAARIGGISLGVTSRDRELSIRPDAELRDFLIEESGCDIECTVRFVDSLAGSPGEAIFESGGLWKLYKNSEGYCFQLATKFLGPEPYKQAQVSRDFSKVEIELLRRHYDSSKSWNPLEYPLDELLWIHRLSTGHGVEMHGCGVITRDGRGLLLTGHSGAGKSTSARLWTKNPGARILSDDRIILRRESDRIWMYGTPWHGDAGIAAADRFPLEAIFVLEHGQANRIRRMNAASASAELFARSFVPHHSQEGLSFILAFFDALTSQVPCFSFSFVANPSAVEALLRADIGNIAAA
jgi:hypothetical protein